MFDLIIRNGTIIDGTGDERFVGDIGINQNIITKIGDLKRQKGLKEVDVKGKFVTPGFIDISNRSDVYWRIFRDPIMESLLRQGITTIVGGNSGSSLAPIYNNDMIASIQKWSDIRNININWETMSEFLNIVESRHISLNFATFVGHSTVRRGIVGDEMRALSSDEIGILEKHLDSSLKEGAFGVSVGLLYTHSQPTTSEELEIVAELAKRRNLLFTVHLRDEGQGLIKSLNEVINVIRKTRVRTHITHLKVVGVRNWPLMESALKIIDDVISEGLEITFDLYPYTYTGSILYTFLPRWLTDGGKRMMLERLKNKKLYDYAVKELNDNGITNLLKNAIISIAHNNELIQGKTINEISQRKEVSVPETILNLLLATEGRVVVLVNALSEENIIKEIDSPYSIITSNAPGYTLLNEMPNVVVHPRSFGSFAKFLSKYVRDKKMISWESAIHKITGKPAKALRFSKRGVLASGYFADIVIFDPEKISDNATISNPLMYASGIDYVFVNGIPVINDGKLTGIRSGNVIRSR